MAKIIQIIAKISGIDKIKTDLKNATDDIENNPIEIPVKVEAEASIAELKRLKNELKKVGAGTDEFKNLFNQIDDLEDKLKSAKQTSSDWIDSLENSGGVLGSVGKGLNGLKVQFSTLGGAIKATGIGLLVATLGLLVGAFKDNEGAMKKLQPLLDGIQKIFQGVFKAVEPLFNILVDLALKALPFVIDGLNNYISAISAVFESIGQVGKAIGKLLKGDFSGAWDTAKTAVTGFSKNFNDAKGRFIEGTKEMTAHEKEEAEKRNEARKKEQERLDKLNAERAKKEAAAKAKREKLAEEEAKRLKEINNSKFALEQKYITDLQNLNAVSEQEKLDLQAQRDLEQILALQKQGENVVALLALYNEKYITLQDNLDKKLADDKAKTDKESADKAKDVADKTADEKKKKDKEIADAQQKQQEQSFALTSDILSKGAELAGESTATGKSLAVASTVISTYSTAQKAYESAFLPVPTVLSPALGAVSAGFAIATGLANVKKILSVKTPKGGGGSVPSAGAISSTPLTPQTNLVGNSTNLNSASATPVNNQANTFTVKAFVSETDITNSQTFISKVKTSAEI